MPTRSDALPPDDGVSDDALIVPAPGDALRSAPTEEMPPDEGPTMTAATAAAGAPIEAGDVFAARYRIVEVVGRGGFCRVFRAVDQATGREVALKLLRRDDPGSAVVSRMQRELRLARDLGHPNIVPVHDLIEEDGVACLVMEFVSGVTLKQEIRDHGRMTIQRGRAVFAELVSAVAAVHAAGIIHRDLKPQNVMVDAAGAIRLLDFGLARASDSTGLTADGTMLGTPDYMSPEQVEGATADARSDVYSLGVIAWELFTGRPPYSGDTPISIAHQHVHSRVPDVATIRDDMPPVLSRLIARMTEPESAKRPSSAEEVLLELERSGDPGVIGRTRTARPLVAAAWIGAALVATVVGVVGLVRSSGSSRAVDPFEDGLVAVAIRPHLPVLGFSVERKLFLNNVAAAMPSSWADRRISVLEIDDVADAEAMGVEHLIEISFRGAAVSDETSGIRLEVVDTADGSVWWRTETDDGLTLDYGEMVATSRRLAERYAAQVDDGFRRAGADGIERESR